MRRRIGPMDLTRDRMVRFVGRAWDQVKSPLYRNAFYIMLAYVVGQALGLVFWVVAYRFYTSNDAGYAIAMLNTLTFLAGVATLGMPVALIRFLPEMDNPSALVNSVMTVSGAIVFVLSLAFIVGLPIWAPGLVVQFWRPEYVPIVVVTAVAYTFGPILDQAAIAARRADLYLWRIVIFSVTKVPVPSGSALGPRAPLGQMRVLGIYMAWSIAFGVSVRPAAFLFIPHAIKGYRPTPRFSRERLRPMFGFSLGNWAAAVIGSAGTLLLPLLIINTLRTNPLGITPSDSTAVFYAATVVAGSLSAIPAATMTSLYAEASQRNAARRRDERRAIALSLGLLVPGIVALWFLADVLLRILFDLRPELADLGSPALQILGLALALSPRLPGRRGRGRGAHLDPGGFGRTGPAPPVHRPRNPHPPRVHADVPFRRHPAEGRDAGAAARGGEFGLARPRVLPRGAAIQLPWTLADVGLPDPGDEPTEYDPVARPRQRAPVGVRRRRRLCSGIAAARPRSRLPSVAGDRPAGGDCADGNPPRPRGVLHPAVPGVDRGADVRLPCTRRPRDLLRDGILRRTHLPRDPAETRGGRPRPTRRAPLCDRDLRVPAHLLPQRSRPRLRLCGRIVLRGRRARDAEPVGRHPEPQPR